MKKKLLLALILIIVVLTVGLWALGSYMMRSSESGFALVSLKDNTLLISDPDVLSYNWTS